MIVTIDAAGRLVVPKPLREQFHLVPGCELEIEAGGDAITLRKTNVEPALVRKGGILVHHGAGRLALDVGQFIRDERAARASRTARTVRAPR